MAAPRVFLVGTGAMGTTLGMALPAAGVEVVGRWTRSEARRAWADQFLSDVPTVSLEQGMSLASMVLVCVKDSALAEMGRTLRALPRGPEVVAHVSGSLPASVLGPWPGVPLGSMHPMLAAADPQRAVTRLPNTRVVLEGELQAVSVLQSLAARLGCSVSTIDANHKPRYHAACVLAANALVALLETARVEAEEAGLQAPLEPLVDLAQSSLDAIRELGTQQALTGPVVRGDAAVVQQHLDVVLERDLYAVLARVALRLARARGLDSAAADALAAILAAVR